MKHVQHFDEFLFEAKWSSVDPLPFVLTRVDPIAPDDVYYESSLPGGEKLEIMFKALNCEPFENGEYDANFYVNSDAYGVKNLGQAYKTLSTVMAVIEDFCEKVRPSSLSWNSTRTSKDEHFKKGKRDLLYEKFFKRWTPEGYKFIGFSYGGGELERMQKEKDMKWEGAEEFLPKRKFMSNFDKINLFDLVDLS